MVSIPPLTVLNGDDDDTERPSTTEVQADLDSVDAAELIEHLSSEDGPTRLTLLYHGSTCKYKQDRAGGSSSGGGSSQVLCLPMALNTAHVAFDLHRKTLQVAESRDTVKDTAERFLQAFLQADVLEESLKIEEEWVRIPSLEDLIELEPFKDTFRTVLLVNPKLTYDGILGSFQRMWEYSPHLPIVAGIMSYQTETFLCLRVKIEPSLYTYFLLDCHARPESDRGPAMMVYKSREDISRGLFDFWEDLPRLLQDEGPDEIPRFSVHILFHDVPSSSVDNKRMALEIDLSSLVSGNENDDRDAALGLPKPQANDDNVRQDHHDTTPSRPPKVPPLQEVRKTAASKQDSPRSPVKTLRHQGSKTRAHNEFGWQMGLQSLARPLEKPGEWEAVKPRTPEKRLPSASQDGPVTETEMSPSRSQSALENGSISSMETKTPESPNGRAMQTRDVKVRRDLAKKDIGWQLVLQEQVGGVKLPSKDELLQKDFAETSSPKHRSQHSLGRSSIHPPQSAHNSSTTNLSQKSGQSSNKPPRFETSRADNERQRPVREDIGWQLGLAAKSMTFPLHQAHGYGTSNTSLNAVGHGAPSPSHQIPSEFGTLQDADAKASSTLISPRSPSKVLVEDAKPSETTDCEYCFGVYISDELIPVGPEKCDHKLCQDCIRRHILQELQACRFPISCPVCILIKRISPSSFDVNLLEKVEFSDVEIDKFHALEFQTVPVTVPCPKCAAARTFTRQELMLEKSFKCTARNCSFQWCRGCHKEVGTNTHVCKEHRDKTDKVLRRKGGRFCPGCQAYILRSKTENNHMECSSMCGLHFCFACGEVLADTAKGQDIQRFEYLHYQQGVCRQYGNLKDDNCSVQ